MKLPRDVPLQDMDISDEDLGLSFGEYRKEKEEPNIIRELIDSIEKLCNEIKKLRENIKDD